MKKKLAIVCRTPAQHYKGHLWKGYSTCLRCKVPQELAFWDNVRTRADCWIWTGGRAPNGYGVYNWHGRPYNVQKVAWRISRGSWPAKGRVIMHTCSNNKLCVRPKHLELGSMKETVHGVIRQRGYPGAKLTLSQAEEIRRLRHTGVPWRTLAKRFRVSESTVYRCMKRNNFKVLREVEPPERKNKRS